MRGRVFARYPPPSAKAVSNSKTKAKWGRVAHGKNATTARTTQAEMRQELFYNKTFNISGSNSRHHWVSRQKKQQRAKQLAQQCRSGTEWNGDVLE